MPTSPRTEMATLKAQALVRELQIKALPVDPFSIAKSRDIVVQPKPDTEEGVSGMLLRQGNTFGIIYATHIPSEGFQRFSVAHELGHYFLEGHVDQVLAADGFHSSRAGFTSSDPYELEADQFASGLLMPSALLRPEMAKSEAGLAAHTYGTELCNSDEENNEILARHHFFNQAKAREALAAMEREAGGE